jgi:hypothetical protein
VIQPTLTYYANLPEGVSLSWWGGYQQRLYNASNGVGEGEKGIGLAVAGARASASFARLYEAQSGELSRVRHTFIPGVDYSFIQERDQSQLPFFDYDDRVIGQNLVYLSLANSFTGRFDNAAGTEYRELLNVRLSQGYQISGGRRDLLNTADEHHDFTDIRLEATANPSRSISVVTDNHFSPYSYIMTTSSLSASVNDRQGNAAGIGYRRIYSQLDYLEGNFSLNLLSPFVFKYTGRYSFDRREFLENYYVAEYRHQCWRAKSSFDAVDSTVKQTAVDILALDRTLARYGGETSEIRKALKEALHQRIETIWPAGSRQPVDLDPLGRGRASQAEALTHAIRSLVPQSDAQRALQARALDHAEKLLESRWMVLAGTESSVPMPFLVILLFWLSITFASFGLFAPRNATVVATLLVCALSVASAVFLVLEMDTPFNGMMRVSADPLRFAYQHLNQ